MRPRPPVPPAAPERLCRFDAGDWPEGSAGAAFTAWCAARRAWAAEHPGPPLGDVVDQLAVERRTRRALFLAGDRRRSAREES